MKPVLCGKPVRQNWAIHEKNESYPYYRGSLENIYTAGLHVYRVTFIAYSRGWWVISQCFGRKRCRFRNYTWNTSITLLWQKGLIIFTTWYSLVNLSLHTIFDVDWTLTLDSASILRVSSTCMPPSWSVHATWIEAGSCETPRSQPPGRVSS